MKMLHHVIFNIRAFRFALLGMAMFAVVAIAPMSRAQAPVTITIVNNSALEIRHLYLSPAHNDDWGADELNDSSIAPGATRTLTVSWDGATVKLVGEDRDGCFISTTAETAAGVEWTITGDTPRNCGQ